MLSKNNALGLLGIIFLAIGLLLWAIFMELKTFAVAPMALGGVLLLVYIAMNISFLFKTLTGRSAVEGFNMVVSLIVFLAIVVFVYVLLSRHSVRYDMTEAKKFSLASKTIQLIQGLEEPVLLQFLTQQSQQGVNIKLVAQELMELYKHAAGDNIITEMIDAEKEPDKISELAPVTLNCIYVRLGDLHEKVTIISENELTNAILKIVDGRERKVYFTTGHQERSIQSAPPQQMMGQSQSTVDRNGLDAMVMMMKDDGFEAFELSLPTVNAIPDDAIAVIIAGPKTPFFETEFATLKSYLDRGGKLLIMLEPETETGLEAFLEENYGIIVGNDLVLDNNPLAKLFGSTGPTVPGASVFVPHPIVDAFGASAPMIVFPLVRSITLSEDLPEDAEGTEFIKTSPQSWAESNIEAIRTTGEAGFNQGEDIQGPVSIGIAFSMPAEIVDDATETESTDPSTDSDAKELDLKPETRIVVYGDSDFATNKMYRQSSDLFINTINWIVQQENRIAISAKSDFGEPLMLNQVDARFAIYSAIIMLPSIILLLGIVVVVSRRKRG